MHQIWAEYNPSPSWDSSSRAAGGSVSRAAVPETEMPYVGWGKTAHNGCGAGICVVGGL